MNGGSQAGVRTPITPVVDVRIGELARQSGVSSTTLRYYEKTGLLPSPRRADSGYRAYDAGSVLARLAFIRASQAVGLSLAEIRELIRIRNNGSARCQHELGLIKKRRAEVHTRIRELRWLEHGLAQVADWGRGVDRAVCVPSGLWRAR